MTDSIEAAATPRPYASVNGQWPESPLPKLTDAEAISAVKRLYRFAMKRKMILPCKIVTGNRRTWPRYGVFNVNAEKGWRALVHSVSHYCHRQLYPGKAPHDLRHAFLEREMIKHVVNSNWLDGKLKRPKKPQEKIDKREIRHRRIIARIKSWEQKERRAVRALAKLNQQRRYYERALAN